MTHSFGSLVRRVRPRLMSTAGTHHDRGQLLSFCHHGGGFGLSAGQPCASNDKSPENREGKDTAATRNTVKARDAAFVRTRPRLLGSDLASFPHIHWNLLNSATGAQTQI